HPAGEPRGAWASRASHMGRRTGSIAKRAACIGVRPCRRRRWVGLVSASLQARGICIPQTRNPTELKTAVTFAGGYAVLLLLVARINDVVGTRGVYVVA